MILTDPEHDAGDAEDDGDETGVIDREILRGHHRRHVGLRRGWLTWIVHRRCVPVRRHLSLLFDLCLARPIAEVGDTDPVKIFFRIKCRRV